MAQLSEVLKERGYVYQFSAETLEEITDSVQRTFYLGVDPTADSMHVGNLSALMLLRRLAEGGHKILLVLGGGTGMIGDPKPDVERPLLDEATIAARVEKLRAQVQKLFGGLSFKVVNNADWLTSLQLIEFLRDVGKYFTVNALIKKEAIEARMESEEGISFTEFSYPLLQAYDFWHLFREYDCDVQVGGSDQWGNIVAGVDLIRRKEEKTAFALTIPIIVDRATGKKFGKSEGNAVWLDAQMTSPYQFYQFWFNTSDESVEEYLKLFTLLSDVEIAAAMEMHSHDKKERSAQKLLARKVTELVHGEDEAAKADAVSLVLFGEAGLSSLDKGSAAALRAAAPTHPSAPGGSIVDVLVDTGLATSKREARQFLEDRAVFLNEVLVDASYELSERDFHQGMALLKRGKKNVSVLVLH